MSKNSLIIAASLCILTILWGASSVYYRPFQDFPAGLAVESLRVTATEAMHARAQASSSSEYIQELVLLAQSLDAFFNEGLNRVDCLGMIAHNGAIDNVVISQIADDIKLDRGSVRSWMMATRLVNLSRLSADEAFERLKNDYLVMAADLRMRLLDYFEPAVVDSMMPHMKFLPTKQLPEICVEKLTPRMPLETSAAESVEVEEAEPVDSQGNNQPKKNGVLRKTFGWLPFI